MLWYTAAGMRQVIFIQQSSTVLLVLAPLLVASFGAATGFAIQSQPPLAWIFPALLGIVALVLVVRLQRRGNVTVLDLQAGEVAVAPLFTRLAQGRIFKLKGGDARLIAVAVTAAKLRLRVVLQSSNGGTKVVARLGIFRRDELPPDLLALAESGTTAFGGGAGKL